MIRVDYQRVLIVDKKREDMMFDYIHDKFNNIKDELTQSFILAIEGWKELRLIKEANEETFELGKKNEDGTKEDGTKKDETK
jgi:hypothetical protein